MNKDIKVKDNKQKPKDACPARTAADSEQQPKLKTSCPAIAKPNCMQLFHCLL